LRPEVGVVVEMVYREAVVVVVVVAVVGAHPQEEEVDGCSNLEYLDLSCYHNITDIDIVRLIKSNPNWWNSTTSDLSISLKQ
jgi:hypothetical protein